MKDFEKSIQYKDKTFRMVFNLNVMETIQEEYESIEKWGDLTDGKVDKKTGKIKQEPNAKAVIFGFWAMINEGIDIDNDENGTETPMLSLKQVGRMISEIGMAKATAEMNTMVIESTKSDSKN